MTTLEITVIKRANLRAYTARVNVFEDGRWLYYYPTLVPRLTIKDARIDGQLLANDFARENGMQEIFDMKGTI